jgi:hypothetical protein
VRLLLEEALEHCASREVIALAFSDMIWVIRMISALSSFAARFLFRLLPFFLLFSLK